LAWLRFGLLGCGRIASAVHLGTLGRLHDARLVAFAEADPARRAAARLRIPGVAAYEDWSELLERARIDAVVIALPPALHAAAALEALARGCHLYLEKPLATTLADGQRLVEAWRRAGVVGRIGFNFRFHPGYRAARERIRGGALGEIIEARSSFSTGSGDLPDWKQAAEGGGALADLAPHHVDLGRFLLGREVVEVSEASVRSRRSTDDEAALTLRFEDGILLRSRFSFGEPRQDRFEVSGARGRLAVDRLQDRPLWDRLFAPTRERSYEAALRDFVRAVRSGEDRGPNLADGLASLGVVRAALQAARTGRPTAAPGVAP
jgi:myo-inositol 2-dehydrogenase / D-chiro-inositol 1-dehydrogenase